MYIQIYSLQSKESMFFRAKKSTKRDDEAFNVFRNEDMRVVINERCRAAFRPSWNERTERRKFSPFSV